MKLIRSIIVAGMIGGFASAAQALPITDVFTPDGSPVTLSTGDPYSYQHNLLTHGFDPALDTLSSVTLSLSISGPGGQPLAITLEGTNTLFDNTLNTLLAGQPLAITLSFLQTDGLLNVILTKGGGLGSTFSFTSSTLVAQGINGEDPGGNDPGPGNSIPEPGALALLGLGLIAAGGHFRRRSAL